MTRALRRPRPIAVACLILFSFLTAVPSPAAEPAQADDQPQVEMLWGVHVPLRDGVELAATVFKPKPQPEPLPVVFTMTPYIADNYLDRALYFARHGYVFALVDVRGRGSSAGEFEPFANEGRDGHDVVEWLARQPWSNGKIAMWGGSYAGFNQWSVAKEFPPHLVTIVPAAAAHPAVDFPFQKNVFSSYIMRWLTFTSGATPNAKLFGESPFWIEKYRDHYLARRPYRDLEQVVGNGATCFRKWLEHPVPDAYWDAMAPAAEHYARFALPVLTITGHYDGDQPGAMEYYRRHMRYGSPAAREKHFLIVGPWDHAGTRTPQKEFGGLAFDDASLLDLNDLHRQWYDWTMKGGARPAFLKRRVAYFVAGSGEWKYADSVESIATGRRTLYLDSTEGRANDVFRSGTLGDGEPRGAAPDRFTYDPLDVSPAELEREDVDAYLTDQRYVMNLNGNGVVYHSAPFAAATEVTGWPRLVVWMALDVPDTDFLASLYEIRADGQSILLAEDLVRARYRESLREERLVTAGAIERYVFDGFTFFSRLVAKGSRLRLVVRAPNSIHLQKNFNGGGVVAEEGAADARTAHVTVYHDAEHASFLEIPIVE